MHMSRNTTGHGKAVWTAAVLAGILLLLVQTTARASTLFTAILTGDQETPPNGSPAIGFGTFILSDAQDSLKFGVCYQGLTGSPITGAHFHNAAPGIAGPIVRGVDLTGATTPDGVFSGVWTSTDSMPLTPALVHELFAGNIYFNIHTAPHFLGGEIRGQLSVSQGGDICDVGH